MFENKKIFVFGMARSGYEVAKLLLKNHCSVVITDSKEQDKEHVLELENMGASVVITTDPTVLLDSTFDYVVKNPGIKKDHPLLEKARSFSIPIIGELEVSYHMLPDVKIIGVTGSNGKTTTTTLIYELLKKAGVPVHLGGNIGIPLSKIVEEVKENDTILLEISDHQLCDMYDFKTDISVFTNVSPTHLDFHDSYETYKNMKMRIFNHHTENSIAILNGENAEEMDLTKDLLDQKFYFNGKDAYIKNGHIIVSDYIDIDTETLIVSGKHNYENMMAALLVCKSLEIDASICMDVLKNFKGVEHRIEYVLEHQGIRIYNDSKSTNNVATITALKSFDRPIVLLLGGLDRGQDYEELYPFMKGVKEVVCFGETKDKIKAFCEVHDISCTVVNTLKEAVKISSDVASEGDVVLLSPAHASWDQYACFEDRGNEFKEEVKKIFL